jgi:hypothetical protein
VVPGDMMSSAVQMISAMQMRPPVVCLRIFRGGCANVTIQARSSTVRHLDSLTFRAQICEAVRVEVSDGAAAACRTQPGPAGREHSARCAWAYRIHSRLLAISNSSCATAGKASSVSDSSGLPPRSWSRGHPRGQYTIVEVSVRVRREECPGCSSQTIFDTVCLASPAAMRIKRNRTHSSRPSSLAMIMRWTSEVPSPISSTLASR